MTCRLQPLLGASLENIESKVVPDCLWIENLQRLQIYRFDIFSIRSNFQSTMLDWSNATGKGSCSDWSTQKGVSMSTKHTRSRDTYWSCGAKHSRNVENMYINSRMISCWSSSRSHWCSASFEYGISWFYMRSIGMAHALASILGLTLVALRSLILTTFHCK